MPAIAPADFLQPSVLAGIGDLGLLARTVVGGFLHGMHRSSHAGLSLDFAEHRPYQPGDDLRRIDWRLYGRTDRFYLKTYEADTSADVLFAVDASASMDYGTGAVTKFDYARYLAASLAWLSQQQGDRIGLVTLREDVADTVPPSGRHLQLLLHTLARAKASGRGELSATVSRLARMRGRSGIVVLLSDCYDEPEALRRSLASLQSRGHDLILFHVIDPAERDLPWGATATFEDAESGVRMPLRPDEIRERYRTLFDEHQDTLRRTLGANGIDYVPVHTDHPLDASLRAYLDARMMTTRTR